MGVQLCGGDQQVSLGFLLAVKGDSATCADVCAGFVRFLDAAAPLA